MGPVGQLERLKQQLVDLRGRYSERYPDVIRVTAEIAALEKQLARPASNGHSEDAPHDDPERRMTEQTLNEVQNSLESLRKEEQTLRQVISTYEARVENAPKRNEELQQLSRDYASSKDWYDALRKRYEEAQLAETLEQGQNLEQLRVLDPALPATQPAAPSRLGLLAMGILASLGLGFVAMVVAERLDTTFHTVDDLRGFSNLPTVAAIRRIPTLREARHHRLRRGLVAAAVLLVMAVVAAGAQRVGAGNEQLVRLIARGAQ